MTIETLTRGLWGALIASACSAIPLTTLAQEQSILGNLTVSPGITFDAQRQRLKVSVENQPFAGVIEEVGRQSGVQISLNGSDYDDLTVRFGYRPLREGLKQLLKATNYVMYESQGELRVWILSPDGPEAPDSEFAEEHADESPAEDMLVEARNRGSLGEAPTSTEMTDAETWAEIANEALREVLARNPVGDPSVVQDIQLLDAKKIEQIEKLRALAGSRVPAPWGTALQDGESSVPATFPPAFPQLNR